MEIWLYIFVFLVEMWLYIFVYLVEMWLYIFVYLVEMCMFGSDMAITVYTWCKCCYFLYNWWSCGYSFVYLMEMHLTLYVFSGYVVSLVWWICG